MCAVLCFPRNSTKGLEHQWLAQLVLLLGCCLVLNLWAVQGMQQAVNRVLRRDGERLHVTPKRCHRAYFKEGSRNLMDVALTL